MKRISVNTHANTHKRLTEEVRKRPTEEVRKRPTEEVRKRPTEETQQPEAVKRQKFDKNEKCTYFILFILFYYFFSFFKKENLYSIVSTRKNHTAKYSSLS